MLHDVMSQWMIEALQFTVLNTMWMEHVRQVYAAQRCSTAKAVVLSCNGTGDGCRNFVNMSLPDSFWYRRSMYVDC